MNRAGGRAGVVTQNAPPPKDAPAAVKAITGSVAVQQSKRAREQQESTRVDKEEALSRVMKTAGGKTFYLRDGVWTDSEFNTEARLPETTLTFGSDEYFDLLKRKPALAQFFSLSDRMVVVFEGRVYRVTAGKT